jgi:hypothetical protein
MRRIKFDGCGKIVKKIVKTQTRLFSSFISGNERYEAKFQEDINAFLLSLADQEHKISEIIDIKYDSVSSFGRIYLTALVIYQTEEEVIVSTDLKK